jgi:hypothetical protein
MSCVHVQCPIPSHGCVVMSRVILASGVSVRTCIRLEWVPWSCAWVAISLRKSLHVSALIGRGRGRGESLELKRGGDGLVTFRHSFATSRDDLDAPPATTPQTLLPERRDAHTQAVKSTSCSARLNSTDSPCVRLAASRRSRLVFLLPIHYVLESPYTQTAPAAASKPQHRPI